MKNKESVLQVIKETVRKHGVLSAGLFATVCGAVIFALLPPQNGKYAGPQLQRIGLN